MEHLHGGVRTADLPALVVSTSSRLLEAAQEQASRCGTHRYLVKPFSLDDFLTTLEEMIGAA